MGDSKLEGLVDLIQPDRIDGWVMDSSCPGRRVYVDIFVDHILYARVLANLFRPDLLAAGKGDGYCAFVYSFPGALCNGAERLISVRLADTDIALGGSPQTVLFSLAEGRRAMGQPSPQLLQHVRALWTVALAGEARYWWQWLTSEDPVISADRHTRLQTRETDPEICNLTAAPEGATVRLLDAGSGPLTTLGSVWSGRTVEIVAVDALANQYTRMFAELALNAPAPPVFVELETLSKAFPAAHFDFIHCGNALDRCNDPLRALQEMFTVLRPGGCVRICSEANVAEKTHYAGLHQWNFSLERGRPVLWNQQSYTDVLELLGAAATLESAENSGNMACAVLRRVG
jgi:SAM-dependent methyltransferase